MNIELSNHRNSEAQPKRINDRLDRAEKAIRILVPVLLLVSVMATGLVIYLIVAP